MQAISTRFDFFFRSTKGLILVAIAIIALVTGIWGMLSGPMVEWGVRDIIVDVTNMDLQPDEREGRIIMLYHTIAMMVVAIEVYIITEIVPMKKHQQSTINATITIGYMTATFFGLGFAYFGHLWTFHGLFLFGQGLIFFSGMLLASALWPFRKEYHVKDPEYSNWRGVDLERVAFFVMAVAMLGSALFGAVTGSFWGNGHETFLAEDLIREPHKTDLQLSIIGHLHIMLTLVAVALALIVGKWLDFKGRLHKVAMPFMIFGTIVITSGVWAVVPYEAIAHYIIYGGSVFILTAGLLLVIFGFGKLTRERLAEQEIENASFSQKLLALFHDPLKFGPLWQMVFMNFNVSFVGIFVAIKLDDIFRVWPAREERIILTGHWHVLSGIIATIILLYYADMCNLKGKTRQWFGWIVIIGSDVAFGAATLFEMKRLFVSEYNQQPFVNALMLFLEIGLAALLVILAALMVWRLVDLFKGDGLWKTELAETRIVVPGDPAADKAVATKEVE